ncbi:MAG TPA: hypothetical protein VFB66_12655 [Tepidisphaeraceae bacterium]|nr:hypothetical protein [Tepidisphaeraceae bacterium]
MFFDRFGLNRFGPASDPYLRASCTPQLRQPIGTPPPNAAARYRPRRRLAALSLAVALAAPLCLWGAPASAQEIEEGPAGGEDVFLDEDLGGATPAPQNAAGAPSNQQLIEHGLRQLAAGQYEQADKTLDRVNTIPLPESDRKRVIQAQAQADRFADEARGAEQQLALGDEAAAVGRTVEAKAHYQVVANNRYAGQDVRSAAQERMAGRVAAPKLAAAPAKIPGAQQQVPRKLTARQHYEMGRQQYAKGQWDVARAHFTAARDLGYKPGLFQDSPDKYLKRMEKRQEAEGAKAARAAAVEAARRQAAQGNGRRQPVVLANQQNNGQEPDVEVNVNVEQPQQPAPPDASQMPGVGDPQLQEDLRATATLEEVRRRQNQAEARRMVREARDAQGENDLRRARELYEQANRLDPNNAQAVQGLRTVRELLGEAQPADQSPLTAEEARINAARQEITFRFNDAVRRARTSAANVADVGQTFRREDLLEGRNAIEEAQVARNQNPTLFSEQELRDFDTRLAEARLNLDRAEEARMRVLTEQQRQDELRQFQLAQQEADRERRRTVASLIRTSRELADRHEYEEAIGLVDQILIIDPRNDYAIGVRPLLQDALHFAEQRKWRERFDEEWTAQLNEVEEKRIPYNDILRYPDDWPDISALRDRTVAEERGERPEDAAVYAQLERPLPEVNFDGAAFADVIDFFRDVSGANIFVNWRALEAAGIDRNATVTVRLTKVKFSKALTIVLDSVSGGGATPLGYTIDDGVITISTGEDLDRNTITRVYDIRDLIIDIPDFTDAPDFSLQSASDQASQGGGGGGGGQGLFGNNADRSDEEEAGRTRQEMIDEIIRLVTETVSPDSWRDAGGSVGAVRELQGQLIVTQTPENQRQLVNLLEQLRETRAIQVTIEARFLTISRNYLEDIGVDVDFAFNINSNGRRTWSTIPIDQNGVGQSGSSQFTALPQTGVPGGIGAGLDINTFPDALTLGPITYLDDFQVNFLLRATQASRHASIVTAPRVTLFNGQRAYVLVANQRAYISDLNAQVGTGTGIFDPEIDVVESGVLLDVSATVSADRKYVTMTLRPQLTTLIQLAEFVFQVGAGGGTTDGGIDPDDFFFGGSDDVPTGVVQQPELQITEVRTTVSVPDGGTLLLGGQTIAGEIELEMGVPILSKIPFIKRLFTNRSMAKDEQVLLILVRPTIIIQREVEASQFPLLSNRAAPAGTAQ